ncbi:hypothetical protein N7454_001701 [Penicillium verhagenii]|nr:hypothetical protein N7454_001701 [Penicillium verhagenii]
MGIDSTMLAPGPAGTSMIGESSIDAAARRAHARNQQKAEKEKNFQTEGSEDAESEKTSTGATEGTKYAGIETGAGDNTRVSRQHESGIRKTWERVRGKLGR